MVLAQILIGFNIVHWVILIIVVAAIIGILFVALRQFGIAIPAWLIQVFWIVVAAIVCIGAIKLIASMW